MLRRLHRRVISIFFRMIDSCIYEARRPMNNDRSLRIANLLDAMVKATARIEFPGDTGEGPLSSRNLFAAALRTLARRERDGAAGARVRLEEIGKLTGRPDVVPVGAGLVELERLASTWQAEAEGALRNAGAGLSASEIEALCTWEAGDLVRGLDENGAGSGHAAVEINADLLCAYLRERLRDESIVVSECRHLPGGFGKETYLFSCAGGDLSGDFVIRRDMPVPLIPNACHRVETEFPVVKAVHDSGFEAPDVLWVDTEHGSIPGGDFMVMRRSPGLAGGSLFGAAEKPDPALNDRLGETIARLHALPPLLKLGNLTDTLHTELWSLPVAEVVRRNLASYFAMFLSVAHTYSPATAAVFRWLLDNVPESTCRPCLIHGDIGFHNMLLEDGRLSTVLDWEFAHVGHPAEDLAYAYDAGASDLDWPRVIRAYEAAGGQHVTEREFQYYRILMQARNAVSTNIASAKLFSGEVTNDLRLLSGDFAFRPHVLKAIGAMVGQFAGTYC